MNDVIECPCGQRIRLEGPLPEGPAICPTCNQPLSPELLAPIVVAGPNPPPLKKDALSAGVIDARPLTFRNETNSLSKIERVRDQIHHWMITAFQKEGVEAQVLKSYPYSTTVAVSCECWLPEGNGREMTKRSTVHIVIRSKEFHRFAHELDITVTLNSRPKMLLAVVDFGEADATTLARCLVGRTSIQSLRLQRCRAVPFFFWRPKNKLTRVRADRTAMVMQILLVFGFATLGVGVGVIFIIAAIGMMIGLRFRKTYVISSGKPPQEPRDLIRMDSWQILLSDLASAADEIKSRLTAELTAKPPVGLRLADERIWYLGVDGKEERDQTVAVFRRGISFMHVYRYGKDLYVGWDAHLNGGTWIEESVGTGVDAATGQLCTLHSIRPAWNIPNEYDITDTNCLIEWTHAAVTKVVKRAVEEYKIDQEIDFQILRSERKGIAGQDRAKDVGSKIKSALTSRFKREK